MYRKLELERINAEYFVWMGQQTGFSEGVMSFLEKRPPEWTMKAPRDLPEGFPFE